MNKKRLIGYLFVMVSAGCIHAQEKKVSAQEYKLWYDRPAQVWTEALPLGNGRLGPVTTVMKFSNSSPLFLFDSSRHIDWIDFHS